MGMGCQGVAMHSKVWERLTCKVWEWVAKAWEQVANVWPYVRKESERVEKTWSSIAKELAICGNVLPAP